MDICDIIRQGRGDLGTEGDVYINGQFFCHSLELPAHNNEHDISCIVPPKDFYLCQWSHMEHANVDHYQIMGVPNRTGEFIHSGNTLEDIKGCIILGSKLITIKQGLFLCDSHDTVSKFESVMGKRPFQLRIRYGS